MSATPTLTPATWLASYGDYLFSYAMLKVGNRETAEDLVQETFISALRAREAFKGDSSEKTWLTAILKNKIIDYYRRKDVLKQAASIQADDDDDYMSHYFEKATGHWHRQSAPRLWPTAADAALNSAEFERALQHCIHKMPPRLIPVFVAKFIDDEDSQTICKDHDISASNYWVLIHRAKVLMRSCLEKNWFLSPAAK